MNKVIMIENSAENPNGKKPYS